MRRWKISFAPPTASDGVVYRSCTVHAETAHDAQEQVRHRYPEFQIVKCEQIYSHSSLPPRTAGAEGRFDELKGETDG